MTEGAPDGRAATGTTAPRTSLVAPMAWGFVVGSALFVVGVPLSESTTLSPAVAGWTFFVGSVLFTTAAAMQLVLAVRALPDLPERRRWIRFVRPRSTDGTAAVVQLVGTIAFNVTTLRSAVDLAGRAEIDAADVWRPDAVGSVLFLVSSAIAMAPEVRHRRHAHVRNRSWFVAALNLLGSVLFGVSAIGAAPEGDGVRNLVWSNGGTILGGLCFLVGAALLLRPGGATTEPPVSGAGAPTGGS